MTEPTHRCTVCHALWTHWPDGTWSLRSLKCGPCCDNVPMADQIVALAPSRAETERDTIARLAAQSGVSGEELAVAVFQATGHNVCAEDFYNVAIIINEALAAAVAKERARIVALLEQYPTPMDDLDMALRIRQLCSIIRSGKIADAMLAEKDRRDDR